MLFISLQNKRQPPPLAGHTLTLHRGDESESLVLIGGFSPQHGFLETVWEFDLEKELWVSLNTTGNGPLGKSARLTASLKPVPYYGSYHGTRVHKFSKNPGVTSKFQVQEG